ncbi:spore coat U domain-containing protein [Nodularia spumigena CS-591/04]|uniref:Csu type fimbrial protein n=1 Tax=Nodularia spumigena TaxID=70799 RepID=UPI00232EC236|nr:spore coat U domain-containing protein [Nodularia spumigena]MDB9320881.1 spore coat U domain-containing protein [Nodularia spumigena CS-591/07A]MDB9332007.1 spore coat U domain-containing protein [Nodularia spumigena CS-591/04]MDB9362768.1 spore coat U domain-containing protein [Nodularia spumigena CS-588/02]MDB9363330.1 spore coat U domain-containing protein [Nodularia spumigena CS-588/02A10]
MIRRFALASAIFIAAGSAAPAMAGTETSNVEVTATVSRSCTISANPIAFGNYDPIGTHATAALEATGSLTTTCTNGSSSLVTLSQGNSPEASSTDAEPRRRLENGNNDFLSYEIFTGETRVANWGNTDNSSVMVSGTGQQVNTTIYARIPAAQNVSSGNYTDTVVATIDF